MAQPCNHTVEERYPLYDGRGIFLAYVCEKCEDTVLAKYRPDIMEYYPTDEQVEDDY